MALTAHVEDPNRSKILKRQQELLASKSPEAKASLKEEYNIDADGKPLIKTVTPEQAAKVEAAKNR